MAWVVPRTWVDGELVQAGLLNSNVRDNMGMAQREVELVDIPADVSNTSTYGSGNGTAVASFAARTYPGYEVEILLHMSQVDVNTAPEFHLGIVDGLVGHTALHELGKGDQRSGTWSVIFIPEPVSHTYRVVVWGGTAIAPGQARLLERGGPD